MRGNEEYGDEEAHYYAEKFAIDQVFEVKVTNGDGLNEMTFQTFSERASSRTGEGEEIWYQESYHGE